MSEMDQFCPIPKSGGGQRIAVTVTGARTALDATLSKAGWIRVIAEGCNIDVVFGVVGTTIPTFAAASGSENDPAVGYPIKSGTYHDFWITKAITHVCWDSDATGTLYLCRAGRERTGGPAA